jgi:hypothetical protein
MKFNPIEITWEKGWKEIGIINFRFNEKGTRHLLAFRFSKVITNIVKNTEKWVFTIAFMFNWWYRF